MRASISLSKDASRWCSLRRVCHALTQEAAAVLMLLSMHGSRQRRSMVGWARWQWRRGGALSPLQTKLRHYWLCIYVHASRIAAFGECFLSFPVGLVLQTDLSYVLFCVLSLATKNKSELLKRRDIGSRLIYFIDSCDNDALRVSHLSAGRAETHTSSPRLTSTATDDTPLSWSEAAATASPGSVMVATVLLSINSAAGRAAVHVQSYRISDIYKKRSFCVMKAIFSCPEETFCGRRAELNVRCPTFFYRAVPSIVRTNASCCKTQ